MPNLSVLLLILFVALLAILLLRQIVLYRNHRNQLTQITQKLEYIIKQNSQEKLLLFTDDESLIPLLIQLNNLLNHNQKILASHAHTELSMRKMLSNISHDLKTPLTVIIGYLETISAEGDLSPETQDKAEKSYTKALELQALIQEFFSLAKLESGDEQYPLAKINANEICRKNILQFYDSLSGQNWRVELSIPETPVYCIGNEDALDRILNNLISNAIEYGNDGKTLGMNLRCDDKHVYIEVWDKGKGIAESNQDKVFERLYTLEDSRNKRYQGSGLGLTISRRLANVLGGDLTVKSSPFIKTVFTLTLQRIA